MDCDKASYRVYSYLDGELTVWRRWTMLWSWAWEPRWGRLGSSSFRPRLAWWSEADRNHV